MAIVDLSNKRVAEFLGITPRRVQQYLKDAPPAPNETSKVIGHSPETTPPTTLQAGGSEAADPPKLRNSVTRF